MLKRIVAGMLLASALPTMVSAGTLTYDFSFMGSSPADSGTGTLTTSDTLNSKGGYDITGISGVFGGSNIGGLLVNLNQPDETEIPVPGAMFGLTYDNVLYSPPATLFDEFGIAFTVNKSIYNIFSAIADCNVNGCTDAPPGPYALAINDGDNLIYGTFTAKQSGAVPESSTWAMLIVGFGVMGGSVRYSKKARVRAA